MGFYIGQYAEYTRKIAEEDVYAFAELSGDRNPMHLDTHSEMSATKWVNHRHFDEN